MQLALAEGTPLRGGERTVSSEDLRARINAAGTDASPVRQSAIFVDETAKGRRRASISARRSSLPPSARLLPPQPAPDAISPGVPVQGSSLADMAALAAQLKEQESEEAAAAAAAAEDRAVDLE